MATATGVYDGPIFPGVSRDRVRALQGRHAGLSEQDAASIIQQCEARRSPEIIDAMAAETVKLTDWESRWRARVADIVGCPLAEVYYATCQDSWYRKTEAGPVRLPARVGGRRLPVRS